MRPAEVGAQCLETGAGKKAVDALVIPPQVERRIGVDAARLPDIMFGPEIGLPFQMGKPSSRWPRSWMRCRMMAMS
jgi:hypothetical protein